MPVVSVNARNRRILPGSNRHDFPEEALMAIETDPVCGMQVDTETTDLKFEHDGTTYWFCGKGCLLEFRDDPEKYLAPDYQPSM
jgi:YHS domain-containing protein